MVRRIAFFASADPRDRAAQSGSLYYMMRALERHVEEIQLCNPITSLEKRAGRLADAASRRLFRKRIAYDHLRLVARKHGRIGSERLGRRSVDAVLAVMNPVDVACLQMDVPIVLVLDATFALQHDYYPQFTNLWTWSVRQAELVEQAACLNANSLVCSSRWAAQSAIHDYRVERRKVHVIPYGANLDTVPSNETVLQKKPSPTCRLLFVGIGWEEKGGGIAFETLVELENIGVEAELVICGSSPPCGVSHEKMTVVPFLDKNDHRQCEELHRLYAQSDFLILPTRREAFGHVFCEASAFGLPSITSSTGAVPEVVRNGENGYVLPYDATGADFARLIANVYRDRERYRTLVASSRAAYEARMNWDVWAASLAQVLHDTAAAAA
jgi:glycosyltransferase involved in cell wall biosynthesis